MNILCFWCKREISNFFESFEKKKKKTLKKIIVFFNSQNFVFKYLVSLKSKFSFLLAWEAKIPPPVRKQKLLEAPSKSSSLQIYSNGGHQCFTRSDWWGLLKHSASKKKVLLATANWGAEANNSPSQNILLPKKFWGGGGQWLRKKSGDKKISSNFQLRFEYRN